MGRMTTAVKQVLGMTAAARLSARQREIADLEQRIAQLDAAKVERTKALEAERDGAPDESAFEAKAAELAAHIAAPVSGLAWAQKELAAAVAALPALERAAKEERSELIANEAPEHRSALVDAMTRAAAAKKRAEAIILEAQAEVDKAEQTAEQTFTEARELAAALGREVPATAKFTADVLRRAVQSIEAYTAEIARFAEREKQLPHGEGPLAQQARMMLRNGRSDYTAHHHRSLMQLFFGEVTYDHQAELLGYGASEQLADLHADPLRFLARRTELHNANAKRVEAQQRSHARAERAKLESQMREREAKMGLPPVELPDDDDEPAVLTAAQVPEHAGA
jgi:hypothetical protein